MVDFRDVEESDTAFGCFDICVLGFLEERRGGK